MSIPPHILRLAASLLEAASDHYGNHGCNDWKYPADWTADQREEFAGAACDDASFPDNVAVPDWLAMRHVAKLLADAATPPPAPDIPTREYLAARWSHPCLDLWEAGTPDWEMSVLERNGRRHSFDWYAQIREPRARRPRVGAALTLEAAKDAAEAALLEMLAGERAPA